MKKIITLVLVLVLASTALFAEPFIGGIYSPTKTLDFAVVGGWNFENNEGQKTYDFRTYLATTNVQVLSGLGLELGVEDSSGFSDSESIDFVDGIKLSGNVWSPGIGATWYFVTPSDRISFGLGADIFVHFINAKLEIEDGSTTITAKGLIIAPEVAFRLGTELEVIEDSGLFFSAGVVYSLAFVGHLGGSINMDNGSGDWVEMTAKVDAGVPYLGGTDFFVGMTYSFPPRKK